MIDDLDSQRLREITRRHFFRDCQVGLGGIALGSMLGNQQSAKAEIQPPGYSAGSRGLHVTPKAKSIIFLFMAGGPSQLELFEPKPKLQELNGQVIPES